MTVIIRIIQSVALIVIIFFSYKFIKIYLQDKTTEDHYKEIQQQYKAISTEHQNVRPQFEKLQQINKDIVGWIQIPNTSLNYPVLQSKDNKTYLHHDFKYAESRQGSIFMDYRNEIKNPSDNTVIYGHHMGDNSMFSILEKYLSQDFYNHHKEILYDTKYGKYKLEVVSAYRTTTQDYYIQTNFKNRQVYQQFLTKTIKKSKIKTDISISSSDKIITLSTCEDPYHSTAARIVVVAKLLKVDN